MLLSKILQTSTAMRDDNKNATNQTWRQCRRPGTRDTFYESIRWWRTGTVFKTTALSIQCSTTLLYLHYNENTLSRKLFALKLQFTWKMDWCDGVYRKFFELLKRLLFNYVTANKISKMPVLWSNLWH